MRRPLMRQKEAAKYLGVGVTWLRASDCPKVMLPGQGPKGRELVRYDPDDLDTFRASWKTDHHARAS